MDGTILYRGEQLLTKTDELITEIRSLYSSGLYRRLAASFCRATGKFRLHVVGFQNLGSQLLNAAKIADRFLFAQPALHLHINMLGVLFQNILLFLIFKDEEMPV